MLVTIGLSQGRGPSGEGVAGQLHQLDQQYQELARQQQLASALATTEAGSLDGQRAGWPNRSTRWHDRNNSSAIKFASPPRKPNERPDYSAKVPPPGRSRKEQGVATARRLELEALQERIISQQQTLKLLDGQIAARAIGGDQSVSVLAERMAAIAAQRATVVRQERLDLTAPIDGVVGDIAARAGQQIGASDVLLAVVPQQSKLEVELFAPSSVVGFVREGQQVRLMVNAFPYQKYGTIDGTVRWISSVPTQQAIPAAGKPQSEPTFRIRVAMGSDQFRGSVPAGTLRAGMTLDGSLILENRRLWEVLFEPILKAFRR